MAIDIGAEIDTAQEAYIDNADYDDTPSLSKAKLFRTACRKLLMLIPQLSEGDRRKTQFDMLRLENQLNAAERFISTNPPASTGGGVKHLSFSDFRD